ncbi:4'-phosphopantetheinyl transferase superfamily [Cadophora sp. MPI-SDFR-AT-0126]|nr:4'-phosphopantetheinyl transferase superfamily [Leotiomycetes sp. MPI-SDFR-AT-0126]
MKSQGQEFNESEYAQDRALHIEREAARQERDVLNSLSNTFWKKDPSIIPLRSALATWGLTIDDLDVASFHGTSTMANDKNESSVICQQLEHLSRKKGNAVLVLNTSLVLSNRNANNIDQLIEQFHYIVYPNRSIQTDGVKAFLISSFGFGQKGDVFLNPNARVSLDKKSSTLTYAAEFAKKPTNKAKTEATKQIVEALAKGAATASNKIGVDVEDISAINTENDTILERNFTDAERAYCLKAPAPQSSFVGKWSAKEAVLKSLGVASTGAGALLKDVEIINNEKGAPIVFLHGAVAVSAKKAGVKEISISISHSDSQAIAVAVASSKQNRPPCVI